MYIVNITETCLRNGYNCRFDFEGENPVQHVKDFCAERGIPPEKVDSCIRRVTRGTAKGVKLFYTPEPGTRIYVWISIYEKRLG